jgi:hypothetical protein
MYQCRDINIKSGHQKRSPFNPQRWAYLCKTPNYYGSYISIKVLSFDNYKLSQHMIELYEQSVSVKKQIISRLYTNFEHLFSPLAKGSFIHGKWQVCNKTLITSYLAYGNE